MTQRKWTRITSLENVPPRQGRSVRLGALQIAIFNLGDRFVTIENRCPHQGGPLCEGLLAGTTVVCPLHGWRFDLDTGHAVRASLPSCVTTFPTRVEEGIIQVDVSAVCEVETAEAAA